MQLETIQGPADLSSSQSVGDSSSLHNPAPSDLNLHPSKRENILYSAPN